jgi:aryl-alcohol dehydrogenase-like predicted oxidoreductase
VIYRKLGSTGLEVSAVGLGCNNFGMRIDLEATRQVVDKAIDVGITFFDTSDNYGNMGGSETLLGQVLGENRKNVILATKFASPMQQGVTRRNGSRHYIMNAVEASLKRLKTDWIDLYQYHFPDPLTPMEETLRALDDLVKQGKVRYIGISNHSGWQMMEAHWIARHHNLHRFVSVQEEYSLLVRFIEREKIPVMERCGTGLITYFPLACGFLTGKYDRKTEPGPDTRFGALKRLGDRYATEQNWNATLALQDFCQKRGGSLLELAFSWLLAHPIVSTVIAGATKPEQVEQNANAIRWKLTAEDLAEIDKLPRGHVEPL